MSDWVNRLNFAQRQIVTQLYSNGVSISAITRIYQVHHSSVRYHLKKAGVYIKWKKASVDMKKVENLNPNSLLNFHNDKGEKIKSAFTQVPFIGWPVHEKNFPLSYKEYVQREKNRHDILYRHGIRLIQPEPTNKDDDSDVRQGGFTYPQKRRKSAKVTNTSSLGVEITIAE